jgi:hypothetical protein
MLAFQEEHLHQENRVMVMVLVEEEVVITNLLLVKMVEMVNKELL